MKENVVKVVSTVGPPGDIEHELVGAPADWTSPMIVYGAGRVNVGVEDPSFAILKAAAPLHPKEIPPLEPGAIALGTGTNVGQFVLTTAKVAGTIGNVCWNAANP